jgi:peroxiredoxin
MIHREQAMGTTLQEELDAVRDEIRRLFSAEALEIIRRTTKELVDSGQAERALGVGDLAPDFDLPSSSGRHIRSRDLLAKGPLVLNFYRGHWCPFCNVELEALQAVHTRMRAAGASLVAVSPELSMHRGDLNERKGLDFEILHDFGNQLGHAFGLRFTLPEELRSLYRSFGIHLEAANGESSWTLSMPARYIIGPDSRILWARVHADHTERSEPVETLEALQALNL